MDNTLIIIGINALIPSSLAPAEEAVVDISFSKFR
jgi:hypothetical protein